jgi:GntR family transcriptional regulator
VYYNIKTIPPTITSMATPGKTMGRQAQAPSPLQSNGSLLHRQLFVLLRQQILNGTYHVGEQLPTQEALCQQFAVSRITVRRALADLQTQGLVRNEQGVGAFVVGPPRATPAPKKMGFVAELNRAYEETTMKVLSLRVERCPLSIAQELGLGESVDALHVVRVRSIGQVPVMLLDAWMPIEFEHVVTARALKHKPLYQLLSGGADQLGKVIQHVSADLADPRTAQALAVDVNSAILKIDRLMHNRLGQAIQHMAIWTVQQRSLMVMEVDADELNSLNTGRLLHEVQK